MQFSHSTTPTGCIVALTDSFTFNDHHAFRALLDTIKTSKGHQHVLDLSGLEFVDSAALGMLLIANDEARNSGCSLILRHPPERIARLIQLAAMDTIFSIEP
jgi:anti-anti-sigma factor